MLQTVSTYNKKQKTPKFSDTCRPSVRGVDGMAACVWKLWYFWFVWYVDTVWSIGFGDCLFFWYVDRVWVHFCSRHAVHPPHGRAACVWKLWYFCFFGTLTQFGASVLVIVWFVLVRWQGLASFPAITKTHDMVHPCRSVPIYNSILRWIFPYRGAAIQASSNIGIPFYT